MNANDYQKQAARTLIRTLIDAPDFEPADDEIALLLRTLALAAVTGAVVEYVKKGVLHRHGIDQAKLSNLCIDIQNAAINVAHLPPVPSYKMDAPTLMLAWNALGALGETAEAIDAIVHAVLDAQAHDALADKLAVEIGDSAWYLAALCTLLGVALDDVLQANLDKLKRRYPNGWTSEASIARVDVTE